MQQRSGRTWFPRNTLQQVLLALALAGLAPGTAHSQEIPPHNSPAFPSMEPSRPSLESSAPSRSAETFGPQSDPVTNTLNVRRYRLGPGDRLLVVVSGAYAQRSQVVLAPDGTIALDDAGPVLLAGKTLAQAQVAIRRAIGRYYKNCQVSTQLVGVRRFYVDVLGYVAHPGRVEVSASTHASAAVLAAGGVTSGGSERRITVRHANTPKDGILDLGLHNLGQAALESNQGMPPGKAPALGDPELQPGDTVVVPAIGPVVRIYGQVKKGGAFELLPQEDLSALFQRTGGFAATADPHHVTLTRLQGDGLREGLALDLTEPASTSWKISLRDGDEINVFNRTTSKDVITVVGEVEGKNYFAETVNQVTGQHEIQRRALLPIYHGMGVREVLQALGGPTVKADLEHVLIERKTSDGTLKRIPVDAHALLTVARSHDVALQDGDILSVPSREDNVYLLGEVGRPGTVPYTAGFGLRQYLAMAGGLTSSAAPHHARLVHPHNAETPPDITPVDVRAVLEGRTPDISKVQPGDIVLVPRFQPFYRDILEAIAPFAVLRSLFPTLAR